MLGFLGKILPVVGKAFGGDIFSSIFGSFKDHFEHKRELKAAKQNTELQIEKIKAETISKQDTANIEWDQIMAKASSDSWKDEMWSIIFGGIFVGVFIPPLQPYIESGLAILAGMDPVMQGFIGTAIAAAFGQSQLIKWRNRK